MAYEEVGIRLNIAGRREAAQGLKETSDDLRQVGDSATQVEKKTSRMGRAARAGLGALGKGLGFLGRTVKRGLLGLAAAGIASIGYALHKGFGRLSQIEDATASLTGLGHSAGAVKKIMDNALASVKGTAFGMGEAASTAAGAVAAGVKPGRDLERTLKLVADAATIGKSSMGEMGAIFNKVATSNKVQGEVINQLSDRGIPIVQLLGKELGKTSAEVLEMSKKGKIGFGEFRRAMERGMGGAALKSGNTTRGALKNTQAAFGRLGASILGSSGVYSMLGPIFNEIMIAVDGLTARIDPLAQKFQARFGDSILSVVKGSGQRFLDWVDRTSVALPRVIDKLRGIGKGNASSSLGKIGAAFGSIGAAIGTVDWAAVKDNLGQGVADTVSVFGVAIGFAADHVDTLARYMPQLVAGWMAYKVAQAAANIASLATIPLQAMMLASQIAHTFALRANTRARAVNTVAENAGTAAKSRGIVGLVAQKVAMLAVAGATKAMAVAQRILNLVLLANPIGLVIAAAGLLVVGFVMLYKKSETFRNALRAMGRFGVMAFRFLLTAAFATFNGILTAAAKGLGWVPGLGDKIKTARAAFREFGDATIAKLKGVENKLRDTGRAADYVARDRSGTIKMHTLFTGERKPPPGPWAPQERATGGPVRAGRPYVVGERRPELFVPRVNGMILPRVPDSPAELEHIDPGAFDAVEEIARPRQPLHAHLHVNGREIADAFLDDIAGRKARK